MPLRVVEASQDGVALVVDELLLRLRVRGQEGAEDGANQRSEELRLGVRAELLQRMLQFERSEKSNCGLCNADECANSIRPFWGISSTLENKIQCVVILV